MGSREERIAQHVNAVEILIGRNVVAIVVQDNSGEVSVVTPETAAFEVMDVLSRLDWKSTYNRMCEQQARQ